MKSRIKKAIFAALAALSMIGCSDQTGGTANNECSNGIDGKNGSQIYTGQGKPSNNVGSVGDIYIDSISGDLYSKGESGWIKTGNIKGATGDNGADGVSILSVSKSSTDGNIDTYTIYYSNGSTSSFKVTNGSDGIPGAQGEKGEDGHTPTVTIGTNGHWFVDGEDTGYPATGPKGDAGTNGADGKDGVSILSVEKTDGDGTQGTYDTYTIYYSDGSTSTFKLYNAKDGTNGKDGVSVTSIEKTSSDGNVDTYTIYFSDGSTSIFKVTNGSDGKQGQQGEKGEDGHTPEITIGSNGNWYVDGVDTGVSAKGDTGISVTRAYIDDNGNLICVLSDGSTVNAGHVKDVSKRYVNFYVDDELVQTVSVKNGDKVSAPSADVTAGYTINHWNCKQDGGYKWLFSAYTVTSDLNLYADFKYNDYTISFVDTKFDHDIDPLTVTYDKPFVFPEVSQEGYNVSEWQDENGNAFSEGVYRHAGDLTLFLEWSANKYTITLNPNGGEIDGIVSPKTITATYDSQYELPTPTRTNCVFVGWYDSDDKKVSSKATWKGTKDVTYTAKWSTDLNTYNFDAGDGTCDTYTSVYEHWSTFSMPKVTPPDGYRFYGWYLNGVCIPNSGSFWPYNKAGGTIVAKYITEYKAGEIFGTRLIFSNDRKTAWYGLYPKTRVSDVELCTTLSRMFIEESNGWYLYEGKYYTKITANPDSYANDSKDETFDDGTEIRYGQEYWFECERIKWFVCNDESNNGTYKLVSADLLDCKSNAYWSKISGTSAQNYKNSEMRSWLNDEFYNLAFSLNDSYIQTTEVDNSASSRLGNTNNENTCENTNDKVYLLSSKEMYNNKNVIFGCKTTDYAKANGAYSYNGSALVYKDKEYPSFKGYGKSWTRSQHSTYGTFYAISWLTYGLQGDTYGYGNYIFYYSSNDACIQPCITVKIP